MSLKKLFGLSAFPLREEEIVHKLQEAYRNKINEIEFSSGGKVVRVRLRELSPDGLMRDYRDYYAR